MNAQAYDRIAREIFAPVYPVIAGQIKVRTGITQGVCLDVGCGGGYLGIALAGTTDLQFYLMDKSPEMLEIADTNIVVSGLQRRLRTIQGDVHQIPRDDGSVDLVISRGSLFFWDDKTKAFAEIYRVLAPGGQAYIGGGMGTGELFEKIKEQINQRRHECSLDEKGERFADHRVAYRQALDEAGISSYTMTRNEEGLWIRIHKPN